MTNEFCFQCGRVTKHSRGRPFYKQGTPSFKYVKSKCSVCGFESEFPEVA